MSRLVVVGNGMVGHRFVDELRTRDTAGRWQVTVVGDESRPAYDRVALSSWFDGATEADLTLDPRCYDGVVLHLAERATSIDRDNGTVTTDSGRTLPYDALVLA